MERIETESATSPHCLRVAVAQISIGQDPTTNFDVMMSAIREASPYDLLVFPEFALSGRPHLEHSSEASELALRIPLLLDRVRHATSEVPGVVVLPTIYPSDSIRWTNSAFWLARGRVLARHDKALLTPSEQAWCDPGSGPTPLTLDGVTYGLTLCVEGNGSEVVGRLAMAGATVIVHPSFPDSPMTTWPAGEVDPWRVDIAALFPLRLRIRALADQVNIVWAVPAHCGSISRIVSASGEMLACAADERPSIVRADIDTESFPFRNSPTFRRRQELSR